VPAVEIVGVRVDEVLEIVVFPDAKVEDVELCQFNIEPVELYMVIDAVPP
jgi:hypothetical protein